MSSQSAHELRQSQRALWHSSTPSRVGDHTHNCLKVLKKVKHRRKQNARKITARAYARNGQLANARANLRAQKRVRQASTQSGRVGGSKKKLEPESRIDSGDKCDELCTDGGAVAQT